MNELTCRTDYTYKLYFEKEGVSLDGVSRDTFTTFTAKDGTVMKDILSYRTSYKKVVRHINAVGGFVGFPNVENLNAVGELFEDEE